ncbi:DEAD/DEAH box helicase [Microbacter margulisiae]|uniref:Superfamily II DNA/RNA helicase n=1 Tax=Microbacter margulisiae TaxID=1350067 RepID=A0A7W5DR04_9PORP|nr:DEAD/DEAH box helicase [Microbacter margulisiae]MBB3186673.1 superfamily II DNA/RNA helicase [Microbacter margulisiae]
MNFSEFDLNGSLIEAISYMGFEQATPIQEFAIPAILQQHDVLACAQTGTGKTAAFVLPVLHKLIQKPSHGTDTLIIVPTRELAIQINQEIQGFAYFASIGTVAIYGGGDGGEYAQQVNSLSNKVDIVVATPGRLISHLAMGHGDFSQLKHLILDEADKMLDMGFLDDIEKIITHLPKNRQTLMFSATMPLKIRQLANKILKHPEEISLAVSKPAENVIQHVCLAYDQQKIPMIHFFLEQRLNYDSVLIFTSAKNKVHDIVSSLKRFGYSARGISSDLDQDKREEVLREFRSKRLRILVATDVISRGIDIKEINLVVNFDVPHDAEDYVHRIGRTARANNEGEAFTLVNEKDMKRMAQIEELIEQKINRIELPTELGEPPVWAIKQKLNCSKKNHSNHSKRKYYKKKKAKEE